MRPLRAGHRLGQAVSAVTASHRAEASRGLLASSAEWSLLFLADDLRGSDGAAVDSAPARVGTAPTSAGASRPARDGRALVFGGTQQLDTAAGLIGGVTGATVIVAMATTAASGVIFCYSDNTLYYDGRKMLMAIPSAAHIAANNGESVLANRNNVFAPVGIGLRVFAATFDRAAVGAAEFAIYDNGAQVQPDAAFTNDTTGSYAASQAGTIGAYESGANGLDASLRAFGLTATTLTADQVRRLSMLLNAACGAA